MSLGSWTWLSPPPPVLGVPVLLHARWRPCPSVAVLAQLWCSPSVVGCWCAFRKTLCTFGKRVTVITFRSSLPSPDPCLQRRLYRKKLVGRDRLSVSILSLNSSYKPQTARKSSLKVSGFSLPQSGWFFFPTSLKGSKAALYLVYFWISVYLGFFTSKSLMVL